MPRGVLCCQGGTLRALISALVLVQCALILLYWDATRNSTTSVNNGGSGGSGGGSKSPQPLPLQSKASNQHLLQTQGHSSLAEGGSSLSKIPELAAQEFQQNYGSEAPTGGVQNEKVMKETLKNQKASNNTKEHVDWFAPRKNGNELTIPETELLLFKPSTKRKYSSSAKGMSQHKEPSFVITLESNTKQSDRKTVNSNDSSNSKLLYENAQKDRRFYMNNKLLKAPINNITSILTQENQTSSNSYDLQRDQNLYQVRPKSERQRSWYTPKTIMQNGGAVLLNRALSTPLPKTVVYIVDKAKHQTTTSKSSQGAVSRHSTTTEKYTVSTVAATQPTTTERSTATIGTTPALRKKMVFPTFDKPMPPDPFSTVNSSSAGLLYTPGNHTEFHALTPGLPQVFHLPRGTDVFQRYFVKNGAQSCFVEGTATNEGELTEDAGQLHHEGCLCKRGWHGRHCSIPEGVFSSTGARFVDSLRPRNVSRRIISALAFNVEFELLEARLNELDDVVDVFIILESNYTNYGDPKPLLLLQRLRNGYLKRFHHKMLYLFRGHIPKGGREDGWIVDQHMRMFIGQEGMSRVFNTTQDDIFLYTDADELPSREAMLFLRIHDGYSEPIGVSLRWSVFGFFWKQFEATRVVIGCTVGMFRYVFNNDAYQLRSTDYQTQASSKLHAYIASGAFIYDWYMGDNGALAGWHCSWCLPPARIRTKLTSAINADFPRWGDFPEKLELPYLRGLIKTGTWFDDKSRFGMLVNWDSEELFAPKYVLNNFERYKYLLDLDET